MLVLSRKIGEMINIGDNITVTLLSISGKQARIGIIAPPDVAVHREEVKRKIDEQEAVKDE